MRLIDADVLDDKLCDAMRKYDAYDSCDLKIVGGIMEAQDLLDDAPTVDAVEVVRCEECFWWDKAKVNKKGFLICPISGMEISNYDFCSYGERKGNG